MLSREQAQERLKQFAISDGRTRWHDRVNRLPGHLRRIAQPLIDLIISPASYRDSAKRRAAFSTAVQALGALQPRERQEIFLALFPKLAPYAELAWQLTASLPYHTNKAYRAPRLAAAHLATRVTWLQNLLSVTQSYDQEIQWYAAWAPYIGWSPLHSTLGILFAAAINANDRTGEEVFDILIASARGEHEIGSFGHHVTRGLLVARRPDGWEFIEKMLLAAQRQEGLRQAILETIDLAHPQAFRRMLRVIIDYDLARFSATIRALNLWLGFRWDVQKTKLVNQTVAQLLNLFEHPDALDEALASDDAQTNYLALWTLAFEDVETAIPHAEKLLRAARVEQRFIGTHLLAELQLTDVYPKILPMLQDGDLRVSTRVLSALLYEPQPTLEQLDVFDQLAQELPRFPRGGKELAPIVWDWMKLTATRSTVASLLVRGLGRRSPKALIPHLEAMEASDRSLAAMKLAEIKPRDRETQDALLSLVGDASHYVRERALQALKQHQVSPVEAERLEAMLTREASDLRRGIIDMLLKQSDDEVLANVDRLLASSDPQQRLAGLELTGQMQQAERKAEQCRTRVSAFRSKQPRITEAEERLIGLLFEEQPMTATLDDALGLMNPIERTMPCLPRPQRDLKTIAGMSSLVTPAAFELVKSLDDLIDANRTMPVTLTNEMGKQEQLLGNLHWGFPKPRATLVQNKSTPTLPLHDLWETWWRERPRSRRNDDGLELLRAWPVAMVAWSPRALKQNAGWMKSANEMLYGRSERIPLKYPHIVQTVLLWLVYLYPPHGAPDFLLDAVELTWSLIPNDALKQLPAVASHLDSTWRGDNRLLTWFNLTRQYRLLRPAEWSPGHDVRWWQLLRWFDEPIVRESALGIFKHRDATTLNVPRHRAQLDELVAAYRAEVATQADLLDDLLGPRTMPQWGINFQSLHTLSGRKSHELFKDVPVLRELVNRCRERIIDIETRRGELPTAASAPSLALRSAIGADKLVRMLRALGAANLVRGYSFDSMSRSSVLSHLIRVTFPGDSDSFESFAHAVRQVRIPQGRLLEVVVYAPQWAEFVEHALTWEGLADAVWWFHAHTKDSYWHVDPEIREIWKAEATERTRLTGDDLIDGAVDVEWFQRVYRSLGEERWNALYQAAKAGSGGKGHARARLASDAMLGRVDKSALVTRIKGKRHQDSVRALGLVPLAGDREVLERYEVIQEFLRTSKKFGAMRQQSEKRTTTIAMENLARTAGYADPIRLEWAMEARAMADFANGAKTVALGDVSLTLVIDRGGQANLSAVKSGKPLKAVPAKLRKDSRVTELANRKKEIERQASRMRLSLEQAMCRGDTFTGAELQSFFDHPLLRPMIEGLLFTSDHAIGYPTENGRALRSHDGSLALIQASVPLHIAHPHDLLLSKGWHLWQRECFTIERIQPFKQIFRELYVLTAAEVTDQTMSRRYAGQQVQTKQALALLGRRGWVNHPYEGVRRVFYKENLAAWVVLNQGFTTPAEVEGAQIEEVYFSRRGDGKPLPLAEIPPRIFSEAMRDLDLVVSVAHAGGVDPEASASTVEMRAALVAETSALLKLDNVQVQGQHVLIDGKLGSYSVHLGSAVVHRQPGGMVCIVPVPAQQRGRLFLPFADDDPRTAEVLSKVLLLARDTEIRDPVILQQLQA